MQQNVTIIASTDYNFIAAGDWYCNEETKKTIFFIYIYSDWFLIIIEENKIKLLFYKNTMIKDNLKKADQIKRI